MGLAGVFFATSIARILTSGIIDPIIVYKYVLKEKVSKYYLRYILYFIGILITYGVTYYITSFIKTPNLLMFFVKALITLILASGIFIIFTKKTEEFQNVKNSVINFLKKRLKFL